MVDKKEITIPKGRVIESGKTKDKKAEIEKLTVLNQTRLMRLRESSGRKV